MLDTDPPGSPRSSTRSGHRHDARHRRPCEAHGPLPGQGRLRHEHDRIVEPHLAWSPDGSEDADVTLMMLRSDTKNAPITLEIGLRVRRHDATECRTHPDDPHGLTHLECSLEPVVLDETLYPRSGLHDDVRAKAARIEIGILADQLAHVGERAAGQHVKG